jgi:hypothetical protein
LRLFTEAMPRCPCAHGGVPAAFRNCGLAEGENLRATRKPLKNK